jgi:hypothetical protein
VDNPAVKVHQRCVGGVGGEFGVGVDVDPAAPLENLDSRDVGGAVPAAFGDVPIVEVPVA